MGHLAAVELAAVKKKYEGKPYKVIELELNLEFSNLLGRRKVKQQLLRHWFMKRGRLREAYEVYAERQSTANIRHAEGWLASFSVDAVMVIKGILDAPNHPKAHWAAWKIINRTFGDKTTQELHDEQVERENKLKVKEIMERYDGWSPLEMYLHLYTLETQIQTLRKQVEPHAYAEGGKVENSIKQERSIVKIS